MTKRISRAVAATLALLLIGVLAVAPGRQVAAQEPAATSYPVSIYQGTCDQPAVAPSFELGATAMAGTDADEDVSFRGLANASVIETIDEAIDATYETLLDDQQHVIAVHRDTIDPNNIVACGELGGLVDDGRLVVGIRPVGDSGLVGIAVLDEDTEGILGIGENQVNLRVYLMTDAGHSTGDQVGTPAA